MKTKSNFKLTLKPVSKTGMAIKTKKIVDGATAVKLAKAKVKSLAAKVKDNG